MFVGDALIAVETAPAKAKMERVMGIEPTSEAWEASVLPLNYTRRGYSVFSA